MALVTTNESANAMEVNVTAELTAPLSLSGNPHVREVMLRATSRVNWIDA
jgi:hypothetical protein